jgi:hypothetical protein
MNRVTQGALLIAAAGAVVIMLGLFGTGVDIAALVAICLGTVLAAPAGRGPDGGWWSLLGTGAILSVAGALAAIGSEGLGGLLALIGGVCVLVGAAMGFPVGGQAPAIASRRPRRRSGG